MGLFGSLFGKEPDIENFTPHQMKSHVNLLEDWINRHKAIENPSPEIIQKLQEKQALHDKAMATWERKIKEAIK